MHALIGPNGAGKSTLLAAFAGDIRPTAGNVRGRTAPTWTPGSRSELARDAPCCCRTTRVSSPSRVRRGRRAWAAPRGAEPPPRRTTTQAVADAHRRDRRRIAYSSAAVPSLSGGERARAALARVLAQRAGILLLDEPTAALDLHHQEDVLRLARERARAGDAVVVVLHDLNARRGLRRPRSPCSRTGGCVATGTPAEVLTAERIRAVYRQDVDLVPHPATGQPIIVPRR